MKSIWITAFQDDNGLVQNLMQLAGKYGLGADGSFWQDDLAKMMWMSVREKLKDKSISLWVIAGNEQVLTPEVRYGLTLLMLSIKQEKPELPVLWIDSSSKMERTLLPSIFADTPFLAADSTSIGAKFAAMANMPAKNKAHPFRLKLYANPAFGIWLETGPVSGTEWKGTILGLDEGEIKAHGVGSAGQLPDKCMLEYPSEGIELQSGETSYIAWAVQNSIGESSSYFVKIDGIPKAILFGELPQGEEADLHILKI